MTDYMQEIDSILDKNKDVLERLKGDKFSSWENQDLFYRARLTLQMGYPVYVLVEIGDKTHEGELVDAWRWSSTHVTVKVKDELLRVNMNNIKLVKA